MADHKTMCKQAVQEGCDVHLGSLGSQALIYFLQCSGQISYAVRFTEQFSEPGARGVDDDGGLGEAMEQHHPIAHDGGLGLWVLPKKGHGTP